MPCHQARRESSPSENLRSQVNTKLMLNDIKAAIRVVPSDDTVLEVTPEVLQALILKHPSEPEDSVTPIIPAEKIAVTANEKKIIRSFSGGCCGGIDGLRPAHLLDLVAVSTAEAGLHLRRSITNLTNKILRGDVSDYAVKLLFSSNLTALKKKDGGIRPIAVGNVFRRLAAKVGCYAVSRAVSHELLPIQLGVSVKGGAEAAVHAVRTFITNNIDSSDHKVIVKLDMMNAFNSVRRDHVLQTCLDRTPEIAKLSFLAYSKPSSVIASGHSITSSTGDPIGPLLFALAVDQIASGVDSELNVWHLDDATIGGSPESVLSDAQRCITGLKRIGLIVNPKKTEIINVGLAAGKFSRVVNSVNELLPEIKVTELTKMELLGSPILADATRCCIVKKLSEYKRMNDRILLLDGHPGLFLLKNAFSLPRLLFTLRSAPCHHHPELLSEYDVITRSTTEALCNIHFDDNSWSQAKLPVRYGGLGLRTAADQALPAFLSSREASISLVNDILRQPTYKQEDDDEVRAWLDRNLVLPSNTHKQRNWDDIQCSSAVATLVPVLNQHRLACFKAASRPESGVCHRWRID